MTGLTSREVQERIDAGQVNYNDNPNTRTYRQIIFGNVFTFFNLINVILFVLILSVKSYKNSLFIFNIIINSGIGIVQEIRAKKIIDQLAILTQSKTVVLRDGRKWSLATDKLVLDDIIYLKAGDQVPADSVVVSGGMEVNESLLTGEADNLPKTDGDTLYSGSFVTSGKACCRVTKVGSDSYASKITAEAKEFKKHNSELRNSLNMILKVISIIIVPIGLLLFYNSFHRSGNSVTTAVVSTTSALLGMIPEGLILLTSVTLTIGALRLAMKRTLVQELYCIETLAHVDTLCLDKTGTITEGTMEVEKVVPCVVPDAEDDETAPLSGEDLNATAGPESYEGFGRDDNASIGALPESVRHEGLRRIGMNLDEKSGGTKRSSHSPGDMLSVKAISRIIGNLIAVQEDKNATAEALRKRFAPRHDMELSHVIPFSSDRKYSGAAFRDYGTFLIGAAGFLFPEGFEDLKKQCERYAKQGLRVLVLACSPDERPDNAVPDDLFPAALIVLTDVIRPDAPETLAFFREQGVDLKVISGDDPATVAAVAKRAGMETAGRYVDASTLTTPELLEEAVEKYSIFGRVTPQQKKEMVLALKEKGHTVAMTGDGVNDVLALKEADCSIAMAGGSDAAKNIANVVLLDSSFSSMPAIVNQGRRVVNNIRTAASMFLIKTMFSVMLALISILFGSMYPFEPIQMSLISACAVGIPTFLLSQEDNFDKIDHTFLRHVFMNAFPAAITITACVFTVMLVCRGVYHSTEMLSTACVLVTGWNYMSALKTVYAPLSKYRKIIIYSMQVIFFTLAVILQGLLTLKGLEFGMIALVFVLMTFSPVAIEIITGRIREVYRNSLDKEEPGPIGRFLEKLRK